MNANRWAVALGFLFLFHTSKAFADTPAEAEAKLRFEEGNALWGQDKHEEARRKFEQAHAVLKEPGVIFHLARAEMTVGHPERAYVLFRDYLKLPDTDADRSLLARKHFADLSQNVGLITLSAATPAGTKVLVDGRFAGEAPLTEAIVVALGKHDVVLAHADQTKEVPVSCPVQETVTLELLPQAKAPGGPAFAPGLAALPFTKQQGNWVPTIVLGMVGIGGLAVGGTLGALSASQNDELRSLSQTRPCRPQDAGACAALVNKASSANGLGTGAVIGYLGGGLFIGAAVVTAVVMKPWELRVKDVTMTVSPGLGGGALVGAF